MQSCRLRLSLHSPPSPPSSYHVCHPFDPPFSAFFMCHVSPQIPPSYASSGGSDAKAYAVDPKDRMAMHSLVDAESLGNFVHARTGDSTHTGEEGEKGMGTHRRGRRIAMLAPVGRAMLTLVSPPFLSVCCVCVCDASGHRIEIYHSPYVIIMIMLVLLGLLAIGARFAIDMLPR